MNSTPFLDYTLSVEELAMAFSMVNRADLGKAVLFETFGKLSQQAIEERLKAASHSLLARKYAKIGERGFAVLSDDVQSALSQIIRFRGILQVVINDNEEVALMMNVHLGLREIFTCHWVEQGVVHHIISGTNTRLPALITQLVSIPQSILPSYTSQIQKGKYSIPMETFAELPEMGGEKGLQELIKTGLPQQLAEAFLDDLVQPKKRGSVSYIEVDSENVDKRALDEAVAGLFFLIGKFGWMLTFSKKEKSQTGTIFPASEEILEENVIQLLDKKSKAFV